MAMEYCATNTTNVLRKCRDTVHKNPIIAAIAGSSLANAANQAIGAAQT